MLFRSPELFHRTGPGFEGDYADFESTRKHISQLRTETLQADIRASFDWLQTQTNGHIVSVGFCMGGRVSFLANATVPLAAAASFYGGAIPTLLDRIPQLGAPILMFWGGLDKHILPKDIRSVVDALRVSGKTYTNVEFSDADHGYFCDQRSSYHPRAARQSWALVTDFFRSFIG